MTDNRREYRIRMGYVQIMPPTIKIEGDTIVVTHGEIIEHREPDLVIFVDDEK